MEDVNYFVRHTPVSVQSLLVAGIVRAFTVSTQVPNFALTELLQQDVVRRRNGRRLLRR